MFHVDIAEQSDHNRSMSFDLAEARRSLASTPETLRQMAGSLPERALTYRESPDTWTVVEVLSHLCDGEIVDWIPRIRMILSDGPRRFTPFDREGGFTRYRGWQPPALLEEFGRLRGTSLDTLDRFRITDHDLRGTGEHPELGTVTLEQLIATWATHDLAHLAQISRIATRYFG